ncbi:SOS response-associated peptidase [Capillimicrobium parvum]|uniref:Abasic site processing protein n=1 Tax=Capillimicrobium parvum TaxID=2884022 RepID=A0A9E6Y1F2_9ACTN|nr:SOS response-associated peptidase [Capillimicrobium parvum]UGS38186.1 SOS response-associated protein YedK [Capillimicrobium parvum]
MCGRYTNTLKREDLARIFPEAAHLADATGCERFNIAPTQDVLAVVERKGERRMGPLRWGLVPFWAKDVKIGAKMVNARAETLDSKPAFRDLVAQARSRCLVVADGYYEWLRPEDPKAPKVPVHMALAGRRPFAFAGLWTWWRPPEGGERLATCTIVTTRANAEVAHVHDRMPVMLCDDDSRDAWLDPANDAAALAPLLEPLAAGLLTVTPANPCVNSHVNDGPECLEAPDAPLTLL